MKETAPTLPITSAPSTSAAFTSLELRSGGTPAPAPAPLWRRVLDFVVDVGVGVVSFPQQALLGVIARLHRRLLSNAEQDEQIARLIVDVSRLEMQSQVQARLFDEQSRELVRLRGVLIDAMGLDFVSCALAGHPVITPKGESQNCGCGFRRRRAVQIIDEMTAALKAASKETP